MELNKIIPVIKDVPHMTTEQGTLIYNLILDNDITEILELGIAHGTGSCYMAAALEEKKQGKVITMDFKKALDRKPGVYELAEKCGLTDYINPIFANTTYNWELMKLIDRQTRNGVCEPVFDFCYIDGAHNFEIDCCAFFLVDKLLKPGGFLLFDDLNWTYAKSPSLKDVDWVKALSEDERTTPHIKTLVDLVVLNHPNYHQPSVVDNWFLIRKKDAAGISNGVSINSYVSQTTLKEDFKNMLRKSAKIVLGKIRGN